MVKAIRKPFNKSRESKRYIVDGEEIRHSRTLATALLIIRGEGDDKEILVIKRGPAVKGTGNWSIPCGYLNWDENIYQSACREAYEETGIRIKPKDITLTGIFDQYKTKTQNVVLYFYTIYTGKDYEIPDNIKEFSLNEVTEAKWVKVNGGDKDKISKTTRQVLKSIETTEIVRIH